MAVERKHLAASLAFTDQQDETTQFMHRVRPEIQPAQVHSLMDAISTISTIPVFGATMTVSTELTTEPDVPGNE